MGEPIQSAEIDGLVGYSRDRSFYRSRPGSHPTKVHRESDAVPEMAACDTSFILLNMDMSWDVARLQSEGSTLLCRRCWPKPADVVLRPGATAGGER